MVGALLIGLLEKTVFLDGTVQLAAVDIVELLSEGPLCSGVVDEEFQVRWDAKRLGLLFEACTRCHLTSWAGLDLDLFQSLSQKDVHRLICASAQF